MSMSKNNQAGCVLPEALRRYYLDAMDIQVWQDLNAAPQALQQEAPVVEAAAPVNPQVAYQPQADIETPGDRASWAELERAVTECTKCALHESRTQAVFGVGDHNADLLIIGEAPGRDEDLQGEPFVGRAGQLLNAMLAAIGFQREQVYIANILKCRPPNNRDPSPEEAACCHPWLQQQIDLVNPKVILAIGRIAAHNLLNTDASVGSMRGRQHSYNGIPLIVSYHPAYLLRKPVEKRKSWQDLKLVRSLL
jgi:DNA polymerase